MLLLAQYLLAFNFIFLFLILFLFIIKNILSLDQVNDIFD